LVFESQQVLDKIKDGSWTLKQVPRHHMSAPVS